MAPGETAQFSAADYRRWIDTTERPQIQRQLAAAPPGGSLISILMPCYNTPPPLLRAALDSVLAQHYPHWQLCAVDDGSCDGETERLLREYAARDPRIQPLFRQTNGGIAAASNQGLAACRGQFVALMDHDDVLPRHALLTVAVAVTASPRARLLYSDSDRLDEQGRRVQPYFKPDWNYDLLLGHNYFNHLSVYETGLLRELQGFRLGFDGSQDYDLALRAVERLDASEIVHLPQVLYHWRILESSVSGAALGAAVRAGRRAVREHLQRRGAGAEVEACPGALIHNRILWSGPDEPIAILVYGGAPEQVQPTLAALASQRGTKISAVDSAGADFELANWLRAQRAGHLGLVLAGLLPGDEYAIANMQRFLSRGDIAAVGPRLLDTRGASLPPGRPPAREDTAPCHRLDTATVRPLDRQVPALSPACLVLRRAALAVAGSSGDNPIGDDLALRLSSVCGNLLYSSHTPFRSSSPQVDHLLQTRASAENQLS